MDEDRRRRFTAWFQANYGNGDDARARFMRDSGLRGEDALTKGRVAQLFDAKLPFGERAARNLAVRFGLPEDYFLHDQQPQALSLSPEALRIALQLDSLHGEPERRAWALRFCELFAFTEPPQTSEQTLDLVSEVTNELRAMPLRQAS